MIREDEVESLKRNKEAEGQGPETQKKGQVRKRGFCNVLYTTRVLSMQKARG